MRSALAAVVLAGCGRIHFDPRSDSGTADDAPACTDVQFGPHSEFATASNPYKLAVGDIDNDGALDLAATAIGTSVVSVLRGNGDGTFRPRVELAMPSGPFSIGFADLDANGNLDLLVGSVNALMISVRSGNGDGTFSGSTSYPTAVRPRAFAVARLDANATLDLVSCEQDNGAVSVWLGNGDNSLSGPTTYSAGGTECYSLTVGDLDGNGAPDVIVVDPSNDEVQVLLDNGQGVGAFRAATRYPTGANETPAAVATADVDHDGVTDVITTEAFTRKIAVYLGNGDGALQQPVRWQSRVDPRGRRDRRRPRRHRGD